MASIRLQDIERHSWRMANRDGLLDILFGFMLLGASISALVGLWDTPDWLLMVTLSVIQFGGVGFVIWMRRREVVPRLGRVKFSKNRVNRTRRMRIFLAACVAVTLLLVLMTIYSDKLGIAPGVAASGWVAWATISAVILVPISVIAVFLDYPRLVLHGSLFVIVEFCLIILGLEDASPAVPPLLFGGGSLISFSIGIPIFVNFLRTVPRVAVDDLGGY